MRKLFPYGPSTHAHKLFSGEVPISALRTRYFVVIATEKNVLGGEIGTTATLFTVIEWMEHAGWEVVSIAQDQGFTYAYMRQVTPQGGQPAPGPGHAAG